jgi:hypothetical protein
MPPSAGPRPKCGHECLGITRHPAFSCSLEYRFTLVRSQPPDSCLSSVPPPMNSSSPSLPTESRARRSIALESALVCGRRPRRTPRAAAILVGQAPRSLERAPSGLDPADRRRAGLLVTKAWSWRCPGHRRRRSCGRAPEWTEFSTEINPKTGWPLPLRKFWISEQERK